MTERRRITMERTFDASLDEVWDMWTTKAGIESWWGPEGFRVAVRKLDLTPGGELLYDMIACGAEQIAFMKMAGMSDSHEATIRFREIVPKRKLAYVHLADFIPGVAPYDVETVIELEEIAKGVRMTLTFDAMHDDTWTDRAVQGWTSELGKLERALAA